jgi:hypothetical protein
MEPLGDAIGAALSGFFGNPVVEVVFRVFAGYVILIWLAAALWAFVDARRRWTHPAVAYASAALVIIATPLLFPFALVIHLVLRPAELATDRRLDELRQAAFEVEPGLRCEGCHLPVDAEWLVCPGCRRQLAHRCPTCGGTVGLDWSVCAWCAAELDGTVVPEGAIVPERARARVRA